MAEPHQLDAAALDSVIAGFIALDTAAVDNGQFLNVGENRNDGYSNNNKRNNFGDNNTGIGSGNDNSTIGGGNFNTDGLGALAKLGTLLR